MTFLYYNWSGNVKVRNSTRASSVIHRAVTEIFSTLVDSCFIGNTRTVKNREWRGRGTLNFRRSWWFSMSSNNHKGLSKSTIKLNPLMISGPCPLSVWSQTRWTCRRTPSPTPPWVSQWPPLLPMNSLRITSVKMPIKSGNLFIKEQAYSPNVLRHFIYFLTRAKW
jgi:hypothetical protein